MPDVIKEVLGDGSKYGVKLYYSVETSPLGTAGAVKFADEYFDDEPMVIFNSDILTDVNISKIIDFHIEKKATVTLTLVAVEDPTAYGLVLTDEAGRVTEFLEKPSWERVEGLSKTEINAGIYIVDPKIFRDIPKGIPTMFEHDVFPNLVSDGSPVYGYTTTNYWLDIGKIEKYKVAHEAILRGEVVVRISGERDKNGHWIGENAKVDKSVKVFGKVLVGDNVVIGENSVISDYSTIGEKVSIGSNSEIHESIIWSNARIGSHVKLSNCIIGFGCTIEDGCKISGAVLADNSIIARGSLFDA